MAGTQPELPMILGNCISCNGLMRVPVTTDVTHVARCPHCEVRFPVQQLIASAIPAAEIIEGVVSEEITPIVDRVREQSTDDSEKPRTKFEVPKQLHDGAKHRRRRRRRSRGSDERKDQAIKESGRSQGGRSSSGASRSKINAASVPLASTQSAASAEVADVGVLDEVPMPSTRSSQSYSASDSSSSESSSSDRSSSRSSGSRSRSSSGRSSSRNDDETTDNAVLEWLKIALGGMLALPLAYLGLMWIAGLDPFGVANQINDVAPFIVPDSLVDEDLLPDTGEDEIDSDEAEGLPKPSIDPDEIRG